MARLPRRRGRRCSSRYAAGQRATSHSLRRCRRFIVSVSFPPPDSEKPEKLSQKDLDELRHSLAHLSVDSVRRFYERAHEDCEDDLRSAAVAEADADTVQWEATMEVAIAPIINKIDERVLDRWSAQLHRLSFLRGRAPEYGLIL